MNKLQELKKEIKPYINTLVLDLFEVVRLVDVIDGEDDYYWKFDSQEQIYTSSCVVGFISLKDKLDTKTYENLVRIWNLNSVEKAI